MYYNSYDKEAIYAGMLSEIRLQEFAFSNTFFISGINAANNAGMLRCRGITTVFSILDEEDELCVFEGFDYHRFNIPDGGGDIIPIAEKVANIVDGLSGCRILIHCAVGKSRSVFVLIYYLILKLKISYRKARKLIQKSRPIAAPVERYRKQLMGWRDTIILSA